MYRRKGEKIMRRRYERPSAYIEEFTPNEYVAACGDSGKVYNFKCNAGGGKCGGVYKETNGQPGLQISGRNRDQRISISNSSYHACEETHQANAKDPFIENCYYISMADYLDKNTANAIPVVVWRGEHQDNLHCTTKLDINEWTTAKS